MKSEALASHGNPESTSHVRIQKKLRSLRSTLRIGVFFLFLLAISPLVLALGLLSRPLEKRDPTYTRPSTRALCLARSQLLRGVCKILCFMFNIHIEARGDGWTLPKEHHPLIVANHISYLDIIAIASHFPCAFLAKEEVRSWPLIGPLTAGLGCLYLRREELPSRVKALLNIKNRLSATAVCVFPEGSTSNQRQPDSKLWNTGQAWASLPRQSQDNTLGKPIVAIGLTYPDHLAAAWVDDMEFLPHLFELLKARRIDVQLHAKALGVEHIHPLKCGRSRSLLALETIQTLC